MESKSFFQLVNLKILIFINKSDMYAVPQKDNKKKIFC
jgi:hypothetical protein